MKKRILISVLLSSLIASSALSAQQITQFGGEAAKLERIFNSTPTADDTNWNAQIGANEIVQWNGLWRDDQGNGGTFGNAGTFQDATSGSLSSNLSSLSMSIVSVETTESAGTARTRADSSPNLLGINDSSDNNAQFNAANNEVLTISFNQDVTLLQMIGTGMDFDAERWGIDIGNDDTYELQWNRSDGFTQGSGTVVAATFDVPGNDGRHVATFGSGIAIAAGTEVAISGLQGNMNLHGLVVSAVPEPSAFALFSGVFAMAWIMLCRRR